MILIVQIVDDLGNTIHEYRAAFNRFELTETMDDDGARKAVLLCKSSEEYPLRLELKTKGDVE